MGGETEESERGEERRARAAAWGQDGEGGNRKGGHGYGRRKKGRYVRRSPLSVAPVVTRSVAARRARAATHPGVVVPPRTTAAGPLIAAALARLPHPGGKVRRAVTIVEKEELTGLAAALISELVPGFRLVTDVAMGLVDQYLVDGRARPIAVHRDAEDEALMSEGDAVTVGVLIDHVDDVDGPTVIFPGTRDAPSDMHSVRRVVRGRPAVRMTRRAGQAFAFDANLLHANGIAAGAPRRSARLGAPPPGAPRRRSARLGGPPPGAAAEPRLRRRILFLSAATPGYDTSLLARF